MVTADNKLKDTCSVEEKLGPTQTTYQKQRHYFVDKGPSSQSYGFPVVTYGCENWTMKKAEHQRIDAFNCGLEKTLKSPLNCKEIKPVNPKKKLVLKD